MFTLDPISVLLFKGLVITGAVGALLSGVPDKPDDGAGVSSFLQVVNTAITPTANKRYLGFIII